MTFNPPDLNVYQRFIEEREGITIMASDNAVSVVGRYTRAVKRAQMVVDGELPTFHDRLLAGTDMSGY